jgi:DNA-binding MarR family transcriptional regulator
MFEHCLYFNTTALARQLEKEWASAFQMHSLTAPQAFMLRAVLMQPGLLQSELAAKLSISRPTATRALDALVMKGFVIRVPSEMDGREIKIDPTPSAVLIRNDLNVASAKVTQKLKATLSDDIFSNVVNEIRGIRSALN